MKSRFRQICGVLAFSAFLLMLGFAGALEQNTVPIGAGIIRTFIAFGAWVLFTWLAGGFDPHVYEEKGNRPWSGNSKRR